MWAPHYGTPAYKKRFNIAGTTKKPHAREHTRFGTLNTEHLGYTLFTANVKGSGDDKPPSKSTWKAYVQYLALDALLGHIAWDTRHENCSIVDTKHGDAKRFVGGHVYVRDLVVTEYPSERFNLILCICQGHNMRKNMDAYHKFRRATKKPDVYVDKNGRPFDNFLPVESGAIFLVMSESMIVENYQQNALRGRV